MEEFKKDFEAINAGQLGGRLPLLKPEDLNADQKPFYKYLMDTKVAWANKSGFLSALDDGRVIGPFNVFLYSAEMGKAYTGWIDAESEHSTLSARVRQIIILTVGTAWKADYEIYAHTAAAKIAGLEIELISAIVSGSEPEHLALPEAVAYRFTQAMVTKRKVADDLYNLALEVLSQRGTVDMVHLIGLYIATSAFLNAFEVPAPVK